MVILAVVALVAGILCGLSGVDSTVLTWVEANSSLILAMLMFLVGISVGLQEGILQKIKEYHIKIFIIPFGIIFGTIVGGIVCSMLTRYTMAESTAVVSGLGWYSLAGVAVGNLAGVQLGSIAFLSNLMREIFSFFSIPLIAKRLNYYSCIAPAAATSEDTTLPMMIKYTNEETVVLAVLNGMICSAFVPVLISVCYQVF
ncbi:MAG: lysine exporter LysO family protein [Pygmaiobacter massiliensis]|uniref:lysine exporter LysO family protein n=1 Tax=Pygmaiobacter massiliensis TaxID=1917873 RepID=UPI000C7D26B7|nr:lysine exporter LysO family protein [Pygmaiobacter massiliensis]MDD3202828.1 lysine exporter LysO family protein [Pygmaiobacter massiliensis]